MTGTKAAVATVGVDVTMMLSLVERRGSSDCRRHRVYPYVLGRIRSRVAPTAFDTATNRESSVDRHANVALINDHERYHAPRDHGVPVEFWACPVDTHFPEEIGRTTDVFGRCVGWMSGHLR